MLKTKKRGLSLILSMVMLIAVVLSTFTMTASAQTPDLSGNPNWHTACFTYKIRSTDNTSGTVRETVSVAKNRPSATVYSDNYSYSTTGWMQIHTSGDQGGYCRRDMVCPKDRCYRVTTSAGLRIREGLSTSDGIACTVEYGTYLQIIDVVGGSNMSYVRVRTGDNEGITGYVLDNNYITQVNNASSYN